MDKDEIIAKCQLAISQILRKHNLEVPEHGDPPYLAWEKLLACVHHMGELIDKTYPDISFGYLCNGSFSLSKVEISWCKKYLRFFDLYEKLHAVYYTEGDCCSESWIEHIENASVFKRPFQVCGYEIVEMPDVDVGGDGNYVQAGDNDDYVQAYGVRLFIKGEPTVFIEYRNKSNGYYGGSLKRLLKDDHDWPSENVLFKPLTEDF